MRVLAIAALCCLAVTRASAQTVPASSNDETTVRGIVRKYVDAREKRDPKGLAALFTADADQLTTSGEWRKGRDSVVKGGLASSQANPGAREIAIEVVRFVTPDVAIADGRYEITASAGAPPRRMRTTFVVVRSGADDWRIAAIRNMAPTEPPR